MNNAKNIYRLTLLALAGLIALLRALNWNTDNKFPSYAYIQQAIVASNVYPNRNVVVKGVNVPNSFHMEIYVHMGKFPSTTGPVACGRLGRRA